MADILLAEDDANIREWLSIVLEGERHHVRTAADGVVALKAYEERRPDLLILDVMMPKKSGYDVCTEIRKKDPILPILMLTAKSTEADKVLGLGLGADDYLTKPFGVRELCARVSAMLRRVRVGETARLAKDVFAVGTFKVDARRRVLIAEDGTEQELSALELGVLRLLVAHAGEILSRDRMLNEVWGVNYLGSTRTLDQHVSMVRKKLGPEADLIETIYGSGYRFCPPPPRRRA